MINLDSLPLNFRKVVGAGLSINSINNDDNNNNNNNNNNNA